MPRHLQRQRPWPAATCASRPRWGVAPAGLPTAGSPREARNRRAPCPRTLEDHRSRPAPLPRSRGCGRPEYPPGIRPCSSSSPSRSRTTAWTAPAPAATVDRVKRNPSHLACTRPARHYPFGMRSDLAVVGPPASHPAPRQLRALGHVGATLGPRTTRSQWTNAGRHRADIIPAQRAYRGGGWIQRAHDSRLRSRCRHLVGHGRAANRMITARRWEIIGRTT